ncbi:putative glycosyltransferase [Thiorhodovibrio winogradskyi]|uniref:Glycosyltransferase n=1 Tax=Thiorhodovibrio winogradskyi TaxID=77007 RepID=A0ABZ0S6P2_9GAMM
MSCGIRSTIQISNDSERVMGRIVGVSDGEVIMVRVAPSETFRDIRDNWPDVIMRFAVEGNVYGFKSPILGTLENPSVVFVKWPDDVKSVKLRVHERVPCFLNAGMTCNDQRRDVVITDLSAGGCRIAFSKGGEAAELGVEVEQEILLDISTATAGCQTVRCKIKSLTKEKSPKCGVMFEHLDQDQQLVIDQLMDDIKAIW